jgi:hypothetical protein
MKKSVLLLIITLNVFIESCDSNTVSSHSPPMTVIDENAGSDFPSYLLLFTTGSPVKEKLTVSLEGKTVMTSSDETAVNIHFLPIQGLSSGKDYLLELDSGWSGRLKTPLISADDPSSFHLKLAFGGDLHYGAMNSNAVERSGLLSGIAAAGTHGMYLAGDIVEDGGSVECWRITDEDLPFLLRGVAFASVIGNHDDLGEGADLYKKYFYPPPSGRFWFHHRWGTVHVIGLRLEGSTVGFDSVQEKWLCGILSEISAEDTVIVVSHSFFYSSGYSASSAWYDDEKAIAALCPIFEQYGVDIVVSGHNHYMELLEHNGVYYAVAGSMGGIPDSDATYISPSSIWIKQGCFGWLELDITCKNIGLTFRGNGDAEFFRKDIPR